MLDTCMRMTGVDGTDKASPSQQQERSSRSGPKLGQYEASLYSTRSSWTPGFVCNHSCFLRMARVRRSSVCRLLQITCGMTFCVFSAPATQQAELGHLREMMSELQKARPGSGPLPLWWLRVQSGLGRTNRSSKSTRSHRRAAAATIISSYFLVAVMIGIMKRSW